MRVLSAQTLAGISYYIGRICFPIDTGHLGLETSKARWAKIGCGHPLEYDIVGDWSFLSLSLHYTQSESVKGV
jgi:hypothetical protein